MLVLLARFTVWGRQYWRVTGDYFKGRQSIGVWIWVAVLLLSTIISVRLDVLLSYYGNDLFTALQVAFQGSGAGNEEMRQSGIKGFWTAIIIFAILATIYISRVMLDIYLTQRFIIRWRVWLTDRLTATGSTITPTTAPGSPTATSTTRTSASSTTSTSSPPASAPRPTPRWSAPPAHCCSVRSTRW